MKVKLYKGPFNGRAYTTDGRTDIIIRAPRPMSRRQRYEWDMQNYDSQFRYTGPKPLPSVEARYRMAMRTIQNGPTSFVTAPCTHPDGSVFYEYVEGSKREY